MYKLRALLLGLLVVVPLLAPAAASASADRQSFLGGGIGVQVLSKDGSGTGFYFQGLGGYNFNSLVGLGLHLGYSNVGGVGIQTLDFGAFLQLTDSDSGLYGKFYLDGMNAKVDGGATAHGIAGTQTGFAPGVGLGMLIPSAGDFHMAPEVAYRLGLFNSTVNLITATFNLIWDF
jgi:hypothetical protein